MTAAARTPRRSAPAPAVDDLDLLRRRLRALGRDGHAEIPIPPEPHAVAWVVATMLADIEGLPWPDKSPDVLAAMARATGSVVTEPDGTRVIWLGWGSWVDAARENAERAAAIDRSATVDVLRQLATEIAPAPPVPRAEAAQDAPRGAPMIARTDDLLDGLANEADAEAASSLFLVVDLDDAEALLAAGLDADLATDPAGVDDRAAAAAQRGCPVVFVGAVDSAAVARVRAAAPGAELRWLRDPASPAVALGYCAVGARWTAAEAEAKARTWRRIAASSVLLDRAAADQQGEPFPAQVLPAVLRSMVLDGASAQGVDAAFWGVPLLSILAGCIGATRRVRLSGDWSEPVVLWSATVAPSGAGKSPALRELAQPVRARNRELHERSEAARAAHAALLADAKANRDATPPPPPPPKLRATVSDCTIEALGSRLADNPRGVLLLVDELASWVGGFDRYRDGGDVAAWLSIHGGEALQVDRRGDGSLYVPSACVSVCGTIQPAVGRRIIGGRDNRANGLAARLLMAMPTPRPAVWTDRTIPHRVREDYRRVVASLLDLQHDADGEPVLLELTSEARSLFVTFYNDNGAETYSANAEGDEDVGAMLAKARGAAARIAAAVALAKAAEDGTAELLRHVDGDSMRAGITLARWFAGEARRIYARWADDDADLQAQRQAAAVPALAERLATILRRGPLSMRELHEATGRNLPADVLRAGLAVLKASGRATCDRVPGAGRPREVWSLGNSDEGAA